MQSERRREIARLGAAIRDQQELVNDSAARLAVATQVNINISFVCLLSRVYVSRRTKVHS